MSVRDIRQRRSSASICQYLGSMAHNPWVQLTDLVDWEVTTNNSRSAISIVVICSSLSDQSPGLLTLDHHVISIGEHSDRLGSQSQRVRGRARRCRDEAGSLLGSARVDVGRGASAHCTRARVLVSRSRVTHRARVNSRQYRSRSGANTMRRVDLPSISMYN